MIESIVVDENASQIGNHTAERIINTDMVLTNQQNVDNSTTILKSDGCAMTILTIAEEEYLNDSSMIKQNYGDDNNNINDMDISNDITKDEIENEKLEDEIEEELYYNLLIFCLPMPILKVAKFVAICSTISFLINFVFVMFGDRTVETNTSAIPATKEMADITSTKFMKSYVFSELDESDSEYGYKWGITRSEFENQQNRSFSFRNIGVIIIQKIFEFFVFATEFCVILALFYGITHYSPNCLKPYLIFGLIWNLLLLVLWVICLVELFQQKEEFILKVLSNTSQFISTDNNHYNFDENMKVGIQLSIILLIMLGAIITIGFWFLHIILLAYFYLKQQQKQQQYHQYCQYQQLRLQQDQHQGNEESKEQMINDSEQNQKQNITKFEENWRRRQSRLPENAFSYNNKAFSSHCADTFGQQATIDKSAIV